MTRPAVASSASSRRRRAGFDRREPAVSTDSDPSSSRPSWTGVAQKYSFRFPPSSSPGPGGTTSAMASLPPVESSPLLLMRFTRDCPPDLVTHVKERLARGGIATVEEVNTDNDGMILGLTTTQEELEAEAEHVRLVKPAVCVRGGGGGALGGDPSSSSSGGGGGGDGISDLGDGAGGVVGGDGGVGVGTGDVVMECFTSEARSWFLGRPGRRRGSNDDDDDSDEYDSIGLFTSSDRVMLISSMMDSITVLERGAVSSNLSRKLSELGAFRHGNMRRSFIRRMRRLEKSPDVEEQRNSCLRLVLQENGLVDLLAPVHVKSLRRKLMRETIDLSTPPPVSSLRNYFGEELAYYFAWMDHLTRWLVFPGVVGLATYVGRMRMGDTVDDFPLMPFHGLVIFLWAVLFLRFWEREECRLAYAWGTYSSTGYEKRYFDSRPGFYGAMRISPVTGRWEKYYPPSRRRLKYAVSALVTSALLSVAFLVMILSLNMQGYVRPRDDRERWRDDDEHPFYYPFFANLADEGNFFDAASYWRCYIPVLLHVCVVMSMNLAYRRVAERLTEWENHETWLGHENSLILKRFLFEAFDAYVVLFYLAFYEKDVRKLRGELVSLFNVDTFRRLLVECALPMAMQRMNRDGEDGGADARRKKTDDHHDDDDVDSAKKTRVGRGSDRAPLAREARRDPYEEFDDYLEMVITLGYVTLFASAYPLAAFVAIFASMVEVRTDILKLTKVCLRPRPARTDGIGIWKLLLSAMIWLSALTNCLIFGFSSKQLLQWLPDHYYLDEYGQHRLDPERGWFVVLLVFGIERILVYAALLVNLVVPSVPEDVKVREERRQFVRMQLTQKLRVNERLRQQRSLEVQRVGSVGGGFGTVNG